MRTFLSRIPSWTFYLLIVFTLLMLLFSGFRNALLKQNVSSEISETFYSAALSLGISYDLMVASYLIAIPALAFFIALFFNFNSLWLRRGITIYFSIVFIIAFLACCSDIPCYTFTGARLNNSLLMWTDTPGTMLGFVFGNSVFHPYILLFFLGIIFSIWFLIFLQKKFLKRLFEEKYSPTKKVFSALIVAVLLLIGIRGGWRVRPIAVRDAFVTNYPFVNMLPLNPLFSFFDSMTKINLDYVETQEAIKNVRGFLNVKDGFDSPIARKISFSDSSRKPNIVLVIMESMSVEMTGLSSAKKSFTPNLDSISKNGISFSKFFTCGMHTCNGLYGVLHSLPSVPGMHPLSNVYTANQKFYGMATILKENGYSTNFFCTHFEEFDNMGFFLRNNGFENFFSAKEYTSDLSEGMFGVSDEVQYNFALGKLNAFSKSEKPFFAAMLTISTHEPPTLPAKTFFKPKSKIPFEQVYEYADWALGNFMKNCAKEKWFDNTIFIFVADHGCDLPSPYEIPLPYHHSPFIIFSPSLIKEPKQIDKLALQEDVFPTLMNFLKLNYINNTLGINLFSESRPYAFFCKDYLVGCLNEKYFYIVRKFGGESLHDYTSGSPENILKQHRALADSMKVYTYSMLETAEWLLENKKLGRQ
ncbi:MAG: sulfatase-like hydrolase/transferase [Bacteroidetes bacterium]|nr:sulfatase-like hydrolase/transferase [Bacteroidota bacterium]